MQPEGCRRAILPGEIMENLSPEDIRREIHRFWAIFSGKLTDKIEEMYSPTAIAFTGKAKRSESAKLIALRRSRRLQGSVSSASVDEGAIDVQIVGPDVAIAAYTYSYRTEKLRADGTKVQLDTLFGRATQIFQRDQAGALRIVHEHLSATANPDVEKVAG
jgi:ketosteroid isomerase-like protein